MTLEVAARLGDQAMPVMEAIAKPPEAAVAAPEPVAKFYTPTEAAAVGAARYLPWRRMNHAISSTDAR